MKTFLNPSVKKYEARQGYLQVQSKMYIFYSELLPQKVIAKKLMTIMSYAEGKVEFTFCACKLPAYTVYIQEFSTKLKKIPTPPIDNEAYNLKIMSNGIIISASDEAGLYYGSVTLSQIFRKRGMTIPCANIEDWPDFKFRGFGPFYSGHNYESRDESPSSKYFQLAQQAADFKYNSFAFEIEAFKTPEDLKSFGDFCEDNHLMAVPVHPYLGLAHTDVVKYVEMSEKEFDKAAAPIKKAAALLKSKYFLIGGDELIDSYDHTQRKGIYSSKQLAEKKPHEWLYACLIRFYDFLKKSDITMMLWADFLIDENEFNGYPCMINGYGGKPDYHCRIAEMLPKDIVMLDWHYESAPEYPTINYIMSLGYNVVACPWRDVANPEIFAEYAHKTQNSKLLGMMQVNWETPFSASNTKLLERSAGHIWSPGDSIENDSEQMQIYRKYLKSNPFQRLWPGKNLIKIEVCQKGLGSSSFLVHSTGARSCYFQKDAVFVKSGRTSEISYAIDYPLQNASLTIFDVPENIEYSFEVIKDDSSVYEKLETVYTGKNISANLPSCIEKLKLKISGKNMSMTKQPFLKQLKIECNILES